MYSQFAARILLGGNLKKLYRLTLANVILGFLDLFGVLLFGLIGGLAILGIQSKSLSTRFDGFLKLFNLQDLEFQSLVTILAVTACTLLVGKSIVSALISRRILIYLSIKSAELSRELTSKLFSTSPHFLRKYSEKEVIYALTTGVDDLSLRLVAPVALVISDFALLTLLALGLIFTQPVVAIGTIIYFGVVMVLLHRLTQGKVSEISRNVANRGINISELISQTIKGFRELFVKSQQHHVVNEIGKQRLGISKNQAQLAFIPTIGKYIMETSLVVGALALAAAEFLLVDASQAFSSIAIFMTAGTRIAPALLRIQQSLSTYKVGVATSERTVELYKELAKTKFRGSEISNFRTEFKGFNANVKLEQAFVEFPQSNWKMEAATIQFKANEIVAIVGPSGGGKTTFIDLILGIYEPKSGSVEISGLKPRDAISNWPGAISYVPQESFVMNGSLLENICFGFNLEDVPAEKIEFAIKMSNLNVLIDSLPNGINSLVGETGLKLSGGQRQRLSIARALLTNPKLLVLDEATSALDMESEEAISDMLKNLPSDVLVLMIAHRLTSVRSATKVLYIESGRIRAQGTLEEVRATIPEFNRYAEISGL